LNGIDVGTDPSLITGSNVNLLLNSNGLYINGVVNASAFKASSAGYGYFFANGDGLGFYDLNSNPVMTVSGSTVTVN